MPGCSVVPPIRVSRPDSTCGSSASCCVLLNEWISSTKTTVGRPSRSSASCASSMAARMSLMPASTAEIAMKRLLVTLAASRPSVVLPTPGGPQRMKEWSLRDSKARRSGLPGPSRWRCPTTSASACGRISSARGGTGFVEKRSAMVVGASYSAPRCAFQAGNWPGRVVLFRAFAAPRRPTLQGIDAAAFPTRPRGTRPRCKEQERP